jgi:hypothetical protein
MKIDGFAIDMWCNGLVWNTRLNDRQIFGGQRSFHRVARRFFGDEPREQSLESSKAIDSNKK